MNLFPRSMGIKQIISRIVFPFLSYLEGVIWTVEMERNWVRPKLNDFEVNGNLPVVSVGAGSDK